jgi:hypothetical protein
MHGGAGGGWEGNIFSTIWATSDLRLIPPRHFRLSKWPTLGERERISFVLVSVSDFRPQFRRYSLTALMISRTNLLLPLSVPNRITGHLKQCVRSSGRITGS